MHVFFLRKQNNLNNNPSPEQENPSVTLESTDSTAEPDFSSDSPTLYNRLFRKQNIQSGPETSYENEAWAPEYQSSRLFHRQRGTAEEQFSSPSGPQ